tara:strand:+ start:3329 stop:4495 length:1167 start_codon:yes stop_codon:yes gene_type:complete
MVVAATFAGISAAASITGGIMASKDAAKRNASAKKANKKQKKFAKETAELTNKHNKKLDEADRANYYAMRDFNYDVQLKDWQRGAEMQDYNYLQSLKQFQKSLTISGQQLDLNSINEQQALQSEQDALREAFIQQQFQRRTMFDELQQTFAEANLSKSEQFNQLAGIKNRRDFGRISFANTINTLMEQNNLAKETQLVEGLVEQGAIQAAAQAGKSASKAQQASLAKMQRGLMGLESELSGNAKKAAIQLAELNTSLNLEKEGIGINLQRIDNTIRNAKQETKFNLDVMRENMRSNIDATQRNIEKIRLDRATADLNTRAGMMLFPERISYTPGPELPPERIFVERQKAIPGYVPPPQQQSVWAPLVSGIASAAGTLSSIDYSPGGGN